MCSNCDGSVDCGYIKSAVITKEKGNADCGHIGSGTQLSAASNLYKGSTHNLVYKRRKLKSSTVDIPTVQACENASSCRRDLVYQRRKLQKHLVYRRRKLLGDPSTSFSARLSPKMSPKAESMGACQSFIKSVNPSHLAKKKNTGIIALCEVEAARSSSMSAVINEQAFTNSGTIAECLVQVQDSDGKVKMNRTAEMCSIGDSCSSSMLNMDTDSASLKIQSDDTGECSSSGTLGEAMGEEISEKDLCISILRSNGLLSGWRHDRSNSLIDNVPPSTGIGSFRSCNVCSRSEATGNMLICDHCEAAFHLFCCNPSVKRVPTDEWHCQSCFKKRHIRVKESKERTISIIKSERSSKAAASEGEPGSIASMLRDTQPYTTGVRIGKAFQAAVPDWSGPIAEDADADADAVAEPMKLDMPGTCSLSETSTCSKLLPRFSAIGNWLQCREVIAGIGDGHDGVICGKWRRAPLFEVQTDEWECFRSILWDPTHADCAVPQELETDQVLKQLKYIEMLKPRLKGRRRKLAAAGVNGCRASVANKKRIKCTD
ncbi:hypothetical protein Dimus_002386 [Dionaea muscipula]